MKHKKWWIIAIISIVIVILTSITVYQINNQNDTINTSTDNTKEKKVYKHTTAERVSKNDYFKWEFISNDTASIYPRREALVRDILVDIWDRIDEWDTLAILFNPWVQGEWQSKINIKNTIVSSKNSLLQEANSVKIAKIAELDQKIIQKEVILEETIRNFDAKLNEIWDEDANGSQFQVLQKNLENLEWNLMTAKELKESLINESEKNISQKRELLDTKIDEIYNLLIPILYIGNEGDLNYLDISRWDLSTEFWARNTSLKNELISQIKTFNNDREDLNTEGKYIQLWLINDLLIQVLQNTIISVNVPETVIQGHISNIDSYSHALIQQNEILDDAIYNQSVLISEQREKIQNIELQISQKENEISLLATQSRSTDSEKSLMVSKIKAEIDTLIASKNLLIANENKSITSIENEIAIAQADLNSEYLKSGDYKIISPFSGIISKRNIEVGAKVSMSAEAFRISGVETSLSKITKKEIKFYIPEDLKENVEMWKIITFSHWDNEWKSFTWTIYRISPEVDENNLSITVQAKISENIKLPNKSTIKVNLETKQEIFKIPSSTIYNKDDRKIVYYKKDNWKLWIRDINIISDDWEYSLITWNITDDLKIVTTPIFIK